jgi:putative intracellular protease/amidase
MKRIIALLSFAIVLAAPGNSVHKVLLLVKEGSPQQEFMLANEVGKMMEALKNAGFDVKVATLTGELLRSGPMKIKPDLKISEVKIDDYDGLLLPCMTIDTADPEFITLARAAAEKGKPVAAQAGSVMIIARAGLLKGKKYALSVDMSSDPDFGSGQHIGQGVVQDGNILTSGICPWLAKATGLQDGTEELTKQLVNTILENSK